MKVRTRKASSGVLWEREYNPLHPSAVTRDSVTALATWVGSSPEYECPAAQAVPQKQHRLLKNLVYRLAKRVFTK